ncbi:MAG: LexA family transcriptional regulator [Patescibacteria group bacterium]|nr:LexA family transcriptional regulator [Patescibacteria group bacterium]
MQLTAILQQLIRETGWNQTQLGKELKVEQSTISRWLDGAEPKLHQRDRILGLAKKLGIVKNDYLGEATVPIVGYVGAGGQILYNEGQGPFGEAKMPPKNATENTVAVVVRGDSMAGQLEDGWTVYYDRRQSPPLESLVGKLCVVGLQDGRVLIKKLLPGHATGCYHLYSFNAAPMLDQTVEWAAMVSWIAPT